MTDRIFNFSAGPAVLPEPVLRKAQEAIWNVAGSGIGIMEHSHRGKVFDKILDEAEANCRDAGRDPGRLRGAVPPGRRVAAVLDGADELPARPTGPPTTCITGVWSQKAVKEAKILGGKVHVAASSEATNFDRIPTAGEIKYSANPAYVHLTTNNTIYGTQWRSEPAVPAGVPLVADTSSDMYSRPIDVRKYGLIYAGAQKNLGPSGVVLVIIRKDLVGGRAQDAADDAAVPHVRRRRTRSTTRRPRSASTWWARCSSGSRRRAGWRRWRSTTRAKAKLLYDYIDASDFFRGTVQPDSRSLMNVCFRAPTEELESKFIAEATKRGLDGLKGHRSRRRHAGEHLQRVPARGGRGAGRRS